MFSPRRLIGLSCLLCISAVSVRAQQITQSDLVFFRLSAMTNQMAYEQKGGDMTSIAPLIAEAGKNATTDPVRSYRAYTQALVLMSGMKWTPETELPTTLDFTINRSEEHTSELQSP